MPPYVYYEVGIMYVYASVYTRQEKRGKSMKPLEREFHFYLAHQDELVQQYDGKFLVIVGTTIQGAYNDELEAVQDAAKTHEFGTFLIQKCEPELEIQAYHSRVSFDDAIA